MNSDLKKSVKWLVSHLNKCGSNHKIALSEALVNYAGAFDESNKYICFLRSWTVLEILTNTDQNDLLIKRCIALHGSNATVFQRQKLEALRAYRNEYVHEGGIGLDGGIDPMMACYSVQFFVYNLIIKFHLRYSGFFENIDEANSFLDSYSTDLKQLKSRKKILEKVIKRKARI